MESISVHVLGRIEMPFCLVKRDRLTHSGSVVYLLAC